METNYDETAIRRLEQELGTRIYPGTEIMRDVGSHHFIHSSAQSELVLVPQPSNSPHDPLNWNRWWKGSVIAIITIMSFSQAMGPLALAPIFPELMKTFNADLPAVVDFTGIGILVLGFSNFFWVPLFSSYGRRPAVIFSTLLCIAANIWRALSKSYGSFQGATILNGFAAGPAETALPQIIADILFLHQRGMFQTVFFSFYFSGLMVGPIVAGPMSQHIGWRSFFWLNTALLCVTLILLLFLFPETTWQRIPPLDANRQNIEIEVSCKEISPKGISESPGTTKAAVEELETPQHETEAVAELGFWNGKGYPSKAQFSLWRSCTQSPRQVLTNFFMLWKLLLFPIVELAAFVVSWSASSMLELNLTQSQAFAAPPYNLKAQTIGLFNIAILIGAFIGLATNGVLSDWVAMTLTKKNNGIREPEMRLPAMIPFVMIAVLGNIVVGFGYQYKWSWKVIVLIGYTCSGIQIAALPAIITTYAVDSYKPAAGMLFVSITVNKNLWGYGLSKFLTTWIEKSGFLKPTMLNMSLLVLWCMCAIPFYFWGKTFRKWTAKSSIHNL